MLKRAGRGQDPAGVDGTAQGELAVECPACPHPGRNLPDDWDKPGPLSYVFILYSVPSSNASLRWLNTLILSMDANFKLKSKERGIRDPELAPGWSYFVHEEQYQEFLKNHVDQPEVDI